jgi:hypothetical protein
MAELCTQRDLNCLSEPDRSMRKGTLEKILKGVQSRAGKPDFTADLVRLHYMICVLERAYASAMSCDVTGKIWNSNPPCHVTGKIWKSFTSRS